MQTRVNPHCVHSESGESVTNQGLARGDFSRSFPTLLSRSWAFCLLQHPWSTDPNALPKRDTAQGSRHRPWDQELPRVVLGTGEHGEK